MRAAQESPSYATNNRLPLAALRPAAARSAAARSAARTVLLALLASGRPPYALFLHSATCALTLLSYSLRLLL